MRCPARRVRARLGAVVLVALATTPAHAVVGGGDASRGDSVVMVVNARGGVCSGVLLAADIVLTAAHCLSGTIARVRGSGGLRTVATSALHPEFQANAIQSRRRSIDLALARLDGPLGAPAASLSSNGPPRPGAAIDVAGYGLTSESDPRAIGHYRRADLSVVAPHGVGKVLVWAADPASPRGGRGGCQGDSGGPMRDSSNTVVAILTWSTGHGRARCGHYSQGILVSAQRAWIDRVMAGWGANASWR